MAETHYRLGNFQQALEDFLTFSKNPSATKTEEYTTINYTIGYSYFKLKIMKKP